MFKVCTVEHEKHTTLGLKLTTFIFQRNPLQRKAVVRPNCCVTLRFSADMLARISGLGFIVPEISLQITRKICGVITLC